MSFNKNSKYAHRNQKHRYARNRHIDCELSAWTADNGEVTQAQRRDAFALALKARFAAARATRTAGAREPEPANG